VEGPDRAHAFNGKKYKLSLISSTMSSAELKKRLIDKIQETDNKNLLEEAFRLLQMESEDFEVYKLSEDQKNAVNEARQQIKNGQFLTDDEANKDIDEWLGK